MQQVQLWLLLLALSPSFILASGVFTCTGGLLSIIAHPDDDLYFQSPMILPYVSKSNCMTTVFLTSGDNGLTTAYAESREAGNEAAYAYMAGVTDSYTEVNATLAGQTVVIRTLNEAPSVQRVYFRLPDGGVQGKGFSPSFTSLPQLYFGTIDSIDGMFGASQFALDDLKNALSVIIQARAPASIATLDYMSVYGCGDHPDHLTVARLTVEVASALSYSNTQGYMGYTVNSMAPNLDDAEVTSKENAWAVYAPYDAEVCQTVEECKEDNEPDYLWFSRQYVVSQDIAVNTTYLPGTSFGVTGIANTTVPDCPNLARLEGVTVSASSSASGQGPYNAIDGIIDGYPGNPYAEWSSNFGVAGTVFNITWTTAQTFDTVALYDRPNAEDNMSGAVLSFDDGSSVEIGALYPAGNASVFTFSQKTSASISLRVTSVSFTTQNVGLAEFQVYLSSCNATNVSSDVFSQYQNVAPLAVAEASSASTNQGADKAIDKTVDGYPGDWTKEWASNGEGEGATLRLTWDQPYTLYGVSLFDRPNTADQVTAGTLTFEDGTSLTIGPLNNTGQATNLTFEEPLTTTSLNFIVTGVSTTTNNVGLAELMAFGVVSANETTSNETTFQYPDIAPLATPSGSSFSPGQGFSAAIDTVCDGYPGDYTKEWATNGQQAGAQLTLNWTQTYKMYSAALYDRPNTNDQVLAGTLSFSDGSIIAVGTLENTGSATSVNFSTPIIADAVVFTVTEVSSTTLNVGLSEIMIFGELADNSSDPVGPQYPNVAPLADAQASSRSVSQPASAAIDKVTDGYPGDYTKEWATEGQGVGAVLTLTWTQLYTIYSVTLYDRPNLDDQVLGAELEFSDGTIIDVGTLPNDGSPLAVNFTKVVTDTLKFTVTSVSSSSRNIGLSELMAFGEPFQHTSAESATQPMSSASLIISTVSFNSFVSGRSSGSAMVTSVVSSVLQPNSAATSLSFAPALASASVSISSPQTPSSFIAKSTGYSSSFNSRPITVPSLSVGISALPSSAFVTTSFESVPMVHSTASSVFSAGPASSLSSSGGVQEGDSVPVVQSTAGPLDPKLSMSSESQGYSEALISSVQSTASALPVSTSADLSQTYSEGSNQAASTNNWTSVASFASSSIPMLRPTTSRSFSLTSAAPATQTTVLSPDGSDSDIISDRPSFQTTTPLTIDTLSSVRTSSSIQVSSTALPVSTSTKTTSYKTTSFSTGLTSSNTTITTSTPATKTSSILATTSGTLAPTAASTVTASSYRSASYAPAYAFDGNDSTYWLSKGTTGEWIQINFAQTTKLYAVDLYSISSLLNRIYGGTLSFSDGTQVSVGSVSTTGTLVKFTARKTDWLKFTVTSTNPLASWIGLTEIEALSISS